MQSAIAPPRISSKRRVICASELERLRADLEANEDLKDKFTEACKRIAAEAEGALNDNEVVCKAAAELGYE